MQNPKWLDWAQQLQSIAQAGLTYSKDPYDLERFGQLRQVAAEIVSNYAVVPRFAGRLRLSHKGVGRFG